MRRHAAALLLFVILASIIPFLAINPVLTPSLPLPAQGTPENPSSSENTQETEQIPAESPAVKETPEPLATVQEATGFRILDRSSGKVFTVSPQMYTRGALAAEMPPTFHPEALKAQAVAAHTYALCLQKMEAASPDPDLKGADFSADPEHWKTYTTEECFRERYGEMADAYWKTITDAADAVQNYVMLYDGEVIAAAYHSMSAGMTEDASNVWTGSAPYLAPVESRGDTLAPDYETVQKFSQKEVGDILKKQVPGFSPEEVPVDKWIVPGDKSPSGYVLTVTAGGKTEVPAKDLRSWLGLRSTAFDLSRNGEEFVFTVHGYGHGVGFSQYGADYLARQGQDFGQILAHYYPGAVLGIASDS